MKEHQFQHQQQHQHPQHPQQPHHQHPQHPQQPHHLHQKHSADHQHKISKPKQLPLPAPPALVEILLCSYREPVLRYEGDIEQDLLSLSVSPSDIEEAMDYLLKGRRAESVFSTDNRAGLPGLLHRISATRDRMNSVVALTYRVGRFISGAAETIRDLVANVGPNHSLLLLGPPGVGKTTLLRDVTRLLANEMRKRVVVVDTSNEIAGDHPKPHHCIGRAHRMQVANRRHQHDVLIEAVQNQNPQVIVVDEIGTAEEVTAARMIAQRGVGMIGTAHGISLHSLLKNPTLRALVGGVQAVILGDSEAKKRSQGADTDRGKPAPKTQLERVGAPTFDVVIEVVERRRWRIYSNVGHIIDQLLLNLRPVVEERWMDEKGRMFSKFIKLTKPEESSNKNSTSVSGWFDDLRQSISDY
eukprot:TRINITY_DN2765_c0_g1_i1.p1 TRINITY_DN2765_c0_g1~~TRINITY_DN2765_c0_g1_i1.p1  ORF type:complete len:413 (+),score=119.75 TRINITY_DN2765_c0_g1_i1:157-1395(+)